MRNYNKIIFFALIINLLILSGCATQPEKPKWSLSAAELLASPIYETQIQVFGQVNDLGDLRCSCFNLQSDEESLEVWYDTMENENHAMEPPVSVEGINSGDWVVVTGVLKSGGGHHYSLNDYWASAIELID